MGQPRQFSLAYLFLETFWIGLTLALVRQAYDIYYRHAEFYGYWIPPDPRNGPLFVVLVFAAVFCGSTAAGGLVGRMRLGALAAVTAFTGITIVLAIVAFLSPGIQQ